MDGEVSGLPKDRQPMVLWLQDVRSPGAEEAQEQHRWVDTLVQSLPGFDIGVAGALQHLPHCAQEGVYHCLR